MNNTLLILVAATVSLPSFANIDLSDNITFSGFGSSSWAKSNNQTPLLTNIEISDQSCFDCDTTFGAQIDAYYQAFHASAQLVKRPQDHWSEPELEWVYLGYNYEDLLFRVGRLRIPLFLYSEYYYVGYAYTMARPPTEVYNSILGITAYEGFSATWNIDIDDEQTLAITPFYGLEDKKEVQLNSTTHLEIDTDEMFGINFLLSGDNYRWNLSYLNASYDQRVSLIQFNYIEESNDHQMELYSLGAEYELAETMITAEIQKNNRTSSWYASAQHRIDNLTPYLVYGQQYNEEDLSGESVTTGIRYDLRYNLSINGEWQYFQAKNGLDGAFVAKPVKSNAQLYTVMINFVF